MMGGAVRTWGVGQGKESCSLLEVSQYGLIKKNRHLISTGTRTDSGKAQGWTSQHRWATD